MTQRQPWRHTSLPCPEPEVGIVMFSSEGDLPMETAGTPPPELVSASGPQEVSIFRPSVPSPVFNLLLPAVPPMVCYCDRPIF
ncbi:hypothetical protein BDD12DRAFT_855497 [Trichophaea hybrida]|nr:hypothetical protein BDD12DRAFT_855497 [Trichophaea hybrida]